MAEESLKREYNYCSYKLTPYSGSNLSSSDLLKEIINHIRDKKRPVELIEIDRYANQKGTEKRNLIHLGARWGKRGKRCFCQIALVKEGFLFTLQGKNILEEVHKPRNSKFVRVTHYIIDFTSDNEPVVMAQFNSSAPRISDITYYFRQHSKHFKIATSINHVIHLKVDYAQLETDMRTIFEINVKVNTTKSPALGSAAWFKKIAGFKNEIGYKDVRMEYFFQRRKEDGKYLINTMGLDYARSILGWLKSDTKNIKNLEDLSMSYELEDGTIKDFNFMKNKWTSYFNVPIGKKTGLEIRKEFERQAALELNYYITNGETSATIDE